jgi:predicted Zn finger-like uncharacterized protein
MATMITSCPNCKKQIKVPAEVAGKKIKCKACNTVFVAASTAVRPKSDQPKPPDTYKPVDDDEDEGEAKPYGVTDLDLAPRCPYCAHEMDSHEQVICLNCGYNTVTRQMGKTRRIKDITGMQWFLWLLPGILCVVLFLICGLELVNVIAGYIMFGEEKKAEMDPMARPCYNCCVLWTSIFCIWVMYLTAKFSIKRLILQPKPPEEELH